jgi:cytoskeleton protein RodZ
MQSQSDSDPVVENGSGLEAAPVPMPELTPSATEFAPDELDLGLEFEPMTLVSSAPLPGEVLRQAREARGESLSDVAHTLKLSAHQLEALENGRHDVLPGPTFVRGFLRNYARYLDIDPDPLLEGISARTPTAADLASMLKLDGNVQPAASPRPRGSLLPVLLIVLVALILAGLVAAGIHFRWFDRGRVRFSRLGAPTAAPAHRVAPAAHEIAPPVPEIAPAPETAPVPETVTEPETAPVSEKAPAPETKVRFEPVVIKLASPVPVNIAPESSRPPPPIGGEADEAAGPPAPAVPHEATLRLLFNASTLAEVRDGSGKLIFTRTGTKGGSNKVTGKPPFKVMVKHPGNVKLEFNGQVVDLKGHTNREGIARLTLQ